MKTRNENKTELKDQLARVRLFMENLPHKVFVKDVDLNYLICNRNYAEDLKIAPPDIVGKDDFAFYPKELAEKYRADDRRIIESEMSQELEERYLIDDREYHVLTHKTPIKGAHGKAIGIMGVFLDITRYKVAEETAAHQNRVLNAINTVFRDAMRCNTERELALTCLQVAQDLTGSRFGFIGEVNPAGRFDTIAISNPGWDACRLPESQATLLISNMELRGLWAAVIKNGQSVMTNDPAAHPDSVGIPENHPPLTAFLGVPLKEGDQTFGMMALANKQGGYNRHDQEAAEALSVAIVETFKSKRAEQKLSQQAQEIMELSTPVIQVWEGIVVVPLIGILDSGRTQMFMERFLDRIVATNSTVAMVDITGVPAIDTQTAQHLIEAITAARMLGTSVILTGVSPAIAQTMVHLGIDLSGIETKATLTAGLKLALAMLKLEVVNR